MAISEELTPLQERFCQEFVKCGNASAAYREVSLKSRKWKDKTVWERASVVMALSKVSARIKELQAVAMKRNEVTVDSLAEELNRGMEYAVKFEQIGAYVSAIVAKARLFGLIIDKKDIRIGPLDGVAFEDLKVVNDAIAVLGEGEHGSGQTARLESPGPREATH